MASRRTSLRRHLRASPKLRQWRAPMLNCVRMPSPRVGGNFRGGRESLSFTAVRRLVFYPRRFRPTGAIKGRWWLDKIRWDGTVAMKILITSLRSDASLYPKDIHEFCHTLSSGPQPKLGVPTGAIMRLAFGPEDLIRDSELISLDEFKEPVCHYRQARLEWVQFVITPQSRSTIGGMIAASIVPCSRDTALDDLHVRKSEAMSFSDLLNGTGVIYQTASTPLTLAYSPKPGDYSYQWLQLGSEPHSASPFGTGGDVCFYLDFGYHNLCSDTLDQTTQYAVANALFDVTIQSKVHLRETSSQVMTRRRPLTLVNSARSLVCGIGTTISVPNEEICMHESFVHYEDPPALCGSVVD